MPPLPGMELGSPPPAAPRALPKQYEFRVKWSSNIASLVGGLFFLVGTILFIPMVIVKTWAALFPLLFMTGGFFMFCYGRQHAAGVLKAFRDGLAVQGKIASVAMDTSQQINGRHPWRLVYHFPVSGCYQEGVLTSFDSTVGQRVSGQPLWVLYVEDDPTLSTVYPPLV